MKVEGKRKLGKKKRGKGNNIPVLLYTESEGKNQYPKRGNQLKRENLTRLVPDQKVFHDTRISMRKSFLNSLYK